MKTTTLAIAAAMAASTLAHAQEAVQWRVEDGGNGHWYALIVTPCGNWDACNALSAVQGGHLASVTSGAEQSFLEAIVLNTPNSFGDYWLGGVQPLDSPEPGGGWTWTDGSAWTYSRWGTSQFGHALPDDWPTSAPNEENHLEINLRPPGTTPFGQWNDEGDYPNGALIEWSADCNGDGIVDYGQIRDGSLPDDNGNGVPDACDAIDVPGDYATIQEAIDAAPEGGIIRIGPGTFVENLVIESHSVRIEGAGRNQTTIDGNATLPVIRVTNAESLHIAGIRITNGRRTGDQIMGGGLSAEKLHALTIEDCLIDHNVSDYHGGGLCSLDVVMTTILRTDFVGNIAGPIGGCCGAAGGAASIRGQGGGGPCLGASSAVLEDCRFIDNRAFVDGAGSGGGGALYFNSISDAAMVIRSCHFEENTAEAFGSCLWINSACATSTGSVDIISSIFLGARDATEVIGGSNVGDISIETSFICRDSGTPITIPFHDLGGNLITEECSYADCNNDGVADVIQIFDGTYVDLDGNGVLDLCECDADVNQDGVVNGADISAVLGFWGLTGKPLPAADITRDGIVDGADLAVLLGSWGPCQ